MEEQGKRERILAAALALAGREGLGSLTTRSVAREAGVNLGLLHYYFTSKEELVGETLEAFLGEMLLLFEAKPRDGGDIATEEALADLCVSALDLAAERPALLAGFARNPDHHPTCAAMADTRARLLARIGSLLAPGLGDDLGLVARRSLQLFASLFHPLILSPIPALVFGIDLRERSSRTAYVRGVVTDALRPAPPPAMESTSSPT